MGQTVGWSYEAVGNLLNDQSSEHSLWYDAENRITVDTAWHEPSRGWQYPGRLSHRIRSFCRAERR
jgi:hypothetical protein